MAGLIGRGDVNDPRVVLGGALVAERNALRERSWVSISDDLGWPPQVIVALLPKTARSVHLDGSLLRIVTPVRAADECWGAVEPSRRAVLTATIQALLPDADPGVVVEFNPALREADPERDLGEVPRSPVTVFGGVAVGLLLGMWWYARRSEWILYGVFGLGALRRAAIMSMEWVVTGAVPLATGAASAVMLAEPADLGAIVLGWSAAIVATSISLVVVGAWGGTVLAASAHHRSQARLMTVEARRRWRRTWCEDGGYELWR